ncbi:SDR family oxidoreductase [Paraburkholderia bryophila]|uniref:enoyl-ACP reductase FabI n=1 Tax=Paraburkholderia bryophila TaxID=420952 RepID=UPI00234B50EC|nr:SDR family oxidoreductase [Paraburkholderia bryophila]WCM23157.1 SDR family oxidoreductase [Paraburkholderia bryophila]
METAYSEMSNLLRGKRGIVLGILNKRSAAAACIKSLREAGAEVIGSYLPDTDGTNRRRNLALSAVSPLGEENLLPCDIKNDESIGQFFDAVRTRWSAIDFVVYAIAHVAHSETLTSLGRDDFHDSLEVSVFGFLRVAAQAKVLLAAGGSLIALSYVASTGIVRGYHALGLCKSALESAVRYVADELGPSHVRVNALSLAPFASAASLGNSRFVSLSAQYEAATPLRRLPQLGEMVGSLVFLVSDLSSAVTGDVLFADAGYHLTLG